MSRDDMGVALMVALAVVLMFCAVLCGKRPLAHPCDVFREWSEPDSHPERIPGGLDL